MNCSKFQRLRYEYLEGSLPPQARVDADQHLSQCVPCRETVNRERALDKSVAAYLQLRADSLALSPQAQARVIRAMESAKCDRRKEILSWHFAMPAVFIAALITVCIFISALLFRGKPGGTETAHSQGVETRSPVLVQTFCVVPVYTFRKEGNVVVDSLTYVTNEVSLTLWMAKR